LLSVLVSLLPSKLQLSTLKVVLKVIISAPSADAPMFVMGVNHEKAQHR
jgi:glyceraldehyde-3-phosphate dehydrogenase/erythrose-4-phosphate dehydrogenase